MLIFSPYFHNYFPMIRTVSATAICVLATVFSAVAQENNGIATNQLTDRIFDKYDADSNRQLDVSTESFLRTTLGADPEDTGKIVTKTESRGLLFFHADSTGNGDGAVTWTELQDYIDTFDRNSDGEITWSVNFFRWLFGRRSEWRIFDDQYGERFKYEAP